METRLQSLSASFQKDTIRIFDAQEKDTFCVGYFFGYKLYYFGMKTNERPAWAEPVSKLMKAKRIRQADLCEPLGVETRGAVGHYFSGRRDLSIQQAVALADFLKINLSVFNFDVESNAMVASSDISVQEHRAFYDAFINIPSEKRPDALKILEAFSEQGDAKP